MSYEAWEKQLNIQVTLYSDQTVPAILADAVNVLFETIKADTPLGKPELWKTPAPKGYVPGNLRASWEQFKLSPLTYVIRNDAPYAVRIETGWSTQVPPTGMMRTAVMDWPFILEQAAKRHT